MTPDKPSKGMGVKILILFAKIFEGDLSPGRLTVTTSRSYLAKDLLCKDTGILAVAITAVYDDQALAMDARDENPGNRVNPVEEISNDNQNVWAKDPADVGVEPIIADLHGFKGGLEIV